MGFGLLQGIFTSAALTVSPRRLLQQHKSNQHVSRDWFWAATERLRLTSNTRVEGRLQQMVWCCSSQDETQLRMVTSQARAWCFISAAVQPNMNGSMLSDKLALLRFDPQITGVSLSMSLARIVSQCCSIIYCTVPQINRYALLAFSRKRTEWCYWPCRLSSLHQTVPSSFPSLQSAVQVKARMWCRRWVDLSSLSPVRCEGRLFDAAERQRRTVRPALPHGPTALPAVLKETQQSPALLSRALPPGPHGTGFGAASRSLLIGQFEFDFVWESKSKWLVLRMQAFCPFWRGSFHRSLYLTASQHETFLKHSDTVDLKLKQCEVLSVCLEPADCSDSKRWREVIKTDILQQ